jgi:uncharacterized protein (DUF305 family)
MKFSQSKLTVVNALVLAIVIGFNAGNTRGQQMGDMPYDLHFIDMMIMHHQQGIEMAGMVDTKSKHARLKTFAKKTGAEQQKDIEELQGHRNHFYAGKPPMDPAMMDSMMQTMHPGMTSMEDTRRKLIAAQGTAFDRLFLDTMIHHHQMAVSMAKEATTKAEHAEIKAYALKAVTKQQSEIAEMNRLKGGTTSKKKTSTKPKPKPKPTHKHVH